MGTLTGSVKMWCLRNNSTVIRDHFIILPMPDLVIAHITALANSQGYERGLDPEVGPLQLDVAKTTMTVILSSRRERV